MLIGLDINKYDLRFFNVFVILFSLSNIWFLQLYVINSKIFYNLQLNDSIKESWNTI